MFIMGSSSSYSLRPDVNFEANYFAYFVVFGQRLPCISYWVSISGQFFNISIICKSKSTIKDWWFVPQNLGGLGLTSAKDMIHSLQVHMLCKLILAARTHSAKDVPTWAEPVIRLFDVTISPWGQDFLHHVCIRLNKPRLCSVSSLGQAWGLLTLCSLYMEYASSGEAYAPLVKAR